MQCKPGIRGGIIGGGQLALMLAEAAKPLGIEPLIFCAKDDEPAGQKFGRATGAQPDFCIFENEFVDLQSLPSHAPYFPSLETISLLKNKANQKKLFKGLGFPSADFLLFEGGDLDTWLNSVAKQFGCGFVLKWANKGYDGKGVLRIQNLGNQLRDAKAFCQNAKVYAEEFIPFRRELALVACRSVSGEFCCYPLVLTVSRENVCSYVVGPGSIIQVTTAQEAHAESIAQSLASETDLVGCFGIEFFETSDGTLLINEVAPRVHNTGHYTQDAAKTSQFENHWRAVLGMPLGSTQTSPAFIMVNILGVGTKAVSPPTPQKTNEHLHWYGKKAHRPLRKLGHVNATVDPNRWQRALTDLLEWRSRWEKESQ